MTYIYLLVSTAISFFSTEDKVDNIDVLEHANTDYPKQRADNSCKNSEITTCYFRQQNQHSHKRGMFKLVQYSCSIAETEYNSHFTISLQKK